MQDKEVNNRAIRMIEKKGPPRIASWPGGLSRISMLTGQYEGISDLSQPSVHGKPF